MEPFGGNRSEEHLVATKIAASRDVSKIPHTGNASKERKGLGMLDAIGDSTKAMSIAPYGF
jgi:hypothetical protein